MLDTYNVHILHRHLLILVLMIYIALLQASPLNKLLKVVKDVRNKYFYSALRLMNYFFFVRMRHVACAYSTACVTEVGVVRWVSIRLLRATSPGPEPGG